MRKKNNVEIVLNRWLEKSTSFFKKKAHHYFKDIIGIIHVGANTGQEIELYAKYNLSVLWIEPIPEIFAKLQSNLAGFPKQTALEGLVTDVNNKEYDFHLASNGGASSSILEFDLHKDIWPDVTFKKTIKLYSKTLSTLLSDNKIDITPYDMLIIDTQGSELLVLEGAQTILHQFRYIQTEVADFEAYKGCCQLKDLALFLGKHGYSEVFRKKTAMHPDGGKYFDIIYKRS